jgi:Flp pilus assembly protein TadD
MNDESLWREAVRRAPEKVRPRIQLARTLKAGQALEVLGQARRFAPQDPDIAVEVGRILLAQGQAAASVEEFSHALSVDPRNARTLNNRGVAFEALGQPAAAQADFERALQLDPGMDEARNNLRKLTGAQ